MWEYIPWQNRYQRRPWYIYYRPEMRNQPDYSVDMYFLDPIYIHPEYEFMELYNNWNGRDL